MGRRNSIVEQPGSTWAMVARHIPSIMVIGAVLVAYRLLGVEEWLIGSSIKSEIKAEYDYVIIGGGTSGSVLASRLTEDKDKKVLLLEAGDDVKNEYVDIPIFADKVRGSELDWQYRTVPQKHSCKSHVDKESIWPSGKGLGGTSNINYMQYLRGSRHDYDEWNNNGAAGWGYKDVLPYFIFSEDNTNPGYIRNIFHGSGGRMSVVDTGYSNLQKVMPGVFKEMSIKKRDINGRNQFGFMTTQATVRGGKRWSTYRAFLMRALHNNNLDILTKATVTKIIFDKRTAVGVKYVREGVEYEVKANTEVLLAAGTVGSAKILLLSGIGPRAHLREHKIPAILDLPVGENLQDHVMADPVEYFTDYQFSLTAARAENFWQAWSYSLFGSGLKASPRFREITAYVKTKYQGHFKYPLVALHFVANVGVYKASDINVNEELYEQLHGKPPSWEGFSIFPVLLHPRSKGTVRLASANPEDPPLINPNYFSDETDIKYLREAVKFARKLVHFEDLQNWDFSINNNLIPDCAKFGNWTDRYIDCHIRHITLSGYAPVGTCRIGAASDPTAVVDPHLRVRGTKGLRVVDASIIPFAITGNTYATQIMIAEKIADEIRERNSVKPIQDYFKHLIDIKHEKIREEEEEPKKAQPDMDKSR
eukprot:GHVU01192247.1.p1 GENE.GHVU01192247.1~~GHVU01192247.1.p1  ORF type:complete len:648 (+),score=99.43 GHVU01192247.1:215-2158(+)